MLGNSDLHPEDLLLFRAYLAKETDLFAKKRLQDLVSGLEQQAELGPIDLSGVLEIPAPKPSLKRPPASTK